MIQCPNCQTKHPHNTLFCDWCGAFLVEGNQKETDPVLAIAKVPWMESGETSEVRKEDATSPLGLKLTMPDSGHEVEVPPAKKEVTIGRLDPHSASFPDVDLADYGGLGKGVSRRHAKITRNGRKVFIEDLGSINGTFLNRKQLTPYLAQVLKSGDELQLGRLTLRVSFSG